MPFSSLRRVIFLKGDGELKAKNIFGVIILGFFLVMVPACKISTNNNAENKTNVELIVTKDFGTEKLFSSVLETEDGVSVLDVIGQCLQVKTQSGGFVSSIEGKDFKISSGDSKDWFFYVNGLATDCSASDYKVNNGDKIIWDFHKWGGETFVSAIIGAFPEPFIKGYKNKTEGTCIYYTDSQFDSAKIIRNKLKKSGIKKVNIIEIKDYKTSENNYAEIFIGEWSKLSRNEKVYKINEGVVRGGIFARFDKDSISLLDSMGNTKQKADQNTAVIMATGEGLGCARPVWIISAVEPEAINTAVKEFCNNNQSFKGLYGAAYDGKNVIALPVK